MHRNSFRPIGTHEEEHTPNLKNIGRMHRNLFGTHRNVYMFRPKALALGCNLRNMFLKIKEGFALHNYLHKFPAVLRCVRLTERVSNISHPPLTSIALRRVLHLIGSDGVQEFVTPQEQHLHLPN